MVDSQVALLEDGCQLKLVGSHLVVACLDGNGQLQGLNLQVLHESLYAVGNGAEVVVVHLLVLGTLVTHQRATRHQQVGTGRVESLVDEEVLLFPAEVDLYLLYVVVEVLADIPGSLAYGVQGTQQGRLVVEGFTRIGNEDGGDAQCVVDDEDGRGGVPC